MIHERDEGHDDSEYHFSDDQVHYDAEPETVKAAASAPSFKPAGDGGNPYRRPVIGVLIAAFLIFLVYRILVPTTSVPTTEFSQNTVSTPQTVIPATTQKPSMAQPGKVIPIAEATPTPSQASLPESAPQNLPPPSVAPTLTLEAAKPTLASPSVQQPVAPEERPVIKTASPPPVVTSVPASATLPSQTTTPIDKLISLQEQNTKLVSQLQTEYAQKIAGYETQDSAMQGKIQDLSLRIAGIEATLARLGKALQEIKKNKTEAPPISAAPAPLQQQMMARPIDAHMIYTVQAIIPGRAWLKSDAGDTITVAEGDILKNYGRIMKIDPYDGIVEVDTGGKTLTLSYGATTG